jgi:hypothetical protein
MRRIFYWLFGNAEMDQLRFDNECLKRDLARERTAKYEATVEADSLRARLAAKTRKRAK